MDRMNADEKRDGQNFLHSSAFILSICGLIYETDSGLFVPDG